MNKRIFLIPVIVGAAMILVSFFMPWAHIKTSTTRVAKGLTEKVTGPLKEAPVAGKVIEDVEKVTDAITKIGDVYIATTVRGYNIPRLANRKSSKLALSVTKILFKSAKNLDAKSYAVYLLPLAAVICVILAVIGLKNVTAIAVMVVLSGGIAIGGLYNLLTADFSNLFVSIVIGNGLWFTMYSFLFITLVSIAWGAAYKKK